MKKSIHKSIAVFSVLYFFAFNIKNVYSVGISEDITKKLENQNQNLAENSGFNPGNEVGNVVAAVIGAFLSLLGVIFIILIILAGYNWMTAAGEEEKIKKAKQTLQRAVIGLIITIGAYTITAFVLKNLPGGDGIQAGNVS